MTSRQRVLAALNFTPTDRVPRDLSAMRSTGISAFAYPALVAALGLPPRLPRVYDTWQMLALPDLDVLDALACDVVTVRDGVTNAMPQPALWHPYDFGGRLPALVLDPSGFGLEADGTVTQWGCGRMPPASYVFDEAHGGHRIIDEEELPREDLAALRRTLAASLPTDEEVAAQVAYYHRIRQATDRAVFVDSSWFIVNMGIGAHGGFGIFPLLCLTEPDYVAELHAICLEHILQRVDLLLPAIRDDVDIIMTSADDWGMQHGLLASPDTYRTLFQPYYRQLNDRIHALAPGVKTFMHNCGAIYPLLEEFIASGFDILNPVQWSAGENGPRDWKAICRGRMSLWGGGVNAQATLPLGTVAEVEAEVRQVVPILADGGGYVFCNTHNILAEIGPEKITAMYRAAG
jgi:uroporphyrinogen decarboxylase